MQTNSRGGFAGLSTRMQGIFVETTELAISDWLVALVRTQCPDCKVYRLQDGSETSVRVSNLHNRDYAVLLWLVGEMCCQGWEPFDAASAYSDNGFSSYKLFHMRRTVCLPATSVKES